VTGVVGKAGTGKTRMMRATVDAIESESGQKVFVFAPSAGLKRSAEEGRIQGRRNAGNAS
jgi:ABC-type glutathione transport system ATPase component